MPDMINFGVYIWPKSMLSVTPGKKCCIIKSMSSIIEFISLISKLRSEDIERVIKRKRTICRPECFKMILNSERVKHVNFCALSFHFCVYHEIGYCIYRYLKEKKHQNQVILKCNPHGR